jgi:hypothetical protein
MPLGLGRGFIRRTDAGFRCGESFHFTSGSEITLKPVMFSLGPRTAARRGVVKIG